MVLPLSGFTAFPNPYMIPFMGFQSWVIGQMFGMAYQAGKRKVSAFTNEDFNKLNVADLGLDAMHNILRTWQPQMREMFAEMRPMIAMMIDEIGPLLKKAGEAFVENAPEIVEQGIKQVGNVSDATVIAINQELKKRGLTWSIPNLRKIGVASFLLPYLQNLKIEMGGFEQTPQPTPPPVIETVPESPPIIKKKIVPILTPAKRKQVLSAAELAALKQNVNKMKRTLAALQLTNRKIIEEMKANGYLIFKLPRHGKRYATAVARNKYLNIQFTINYKKIQQLTQNLSKYPGL